jgi:hypothetical protein
MDYKIIEIDLNSITLLDTETPDEWGKPTTMKFILNDTSCFRVGGFVHITIESRDND